MLYKKALNSVFIVALTCEIWASPPVYLLSGYYNEVYLQELGEEANVTVSHFELIFKQRMRHKICPMARVTMSDGQVYLARMPQSGTSDKDILKLRGELYTSAFYRFLGLDYTPEVIITQLDHNNSQGYWYPVSSELETVQWYSGKLISLQKFVPAFDEEVLPDWLQEEHVLITPQLIHQAPSEFYDHGLSWSNLIIVEYLSGETDRLVHKLIEEFMFPQMFVDTPVRNLGKTDRGLVVFDNEFSFGLGYQTSKDSQIKAMQEYFIRRLCIFQPGTVDKLVKLNSSANPAWQFERYVTDRYSSSYNYLLPFSPPEQQEFNNRLQKVLAQINYCKALENGDADAGMFYPFEKGTQH